MSKHPQSNSQFALLLNPNKDKKQLEQEKDKFQSFLKLTNGFILGAKEQSLFEDECRSLFGVSSFIFFTIDKLIIQLTKQVNYFFLKILENFSGKNQEFFYFFVFNNFL